MTNKLNLKKESFILSEDCAKYAEKFMKTAVQVNTPMALADLFMQNSYLKKDLDGSARIFKEALDFPEVRCGGYRLEQDIKLLNNIYTFAFWDYAKKNGLVEEEEADKFVKSIVDLT